MKSLSSKSSLLLCALASIPGASHAIGFGEILSQSAIGEPFRTEVRLYGVGPKDDSSCLRVIPGADPTDGIPAVRNALVSLQMRAGKPVAVVTRTQAVLDPIVRLTLEETCQARLKRTYTLLLPSPVRTIATPQVAVPASRPSPPAARAPASPALSASELGGTWTLPDSASINQLARQLYPSSRKDRIGFIRATRKLNSGDRSIRSSQQTLGAGTTLVLPDREAIIAAHPAPTAPKPVARAPEPAPVEPPAPERAATPPPALAAEPAPAPVEPPAADSGDRLTLSGDVPDFGGFKLSRQLGDPGLIDRTSDAERDLLRREQQLIMLLDEQITARLELTDRIERIEALHKTLSDEVVKQDAPAPAAPASTPAPTAPTVPAAAPAPAPAPAADWLATAQSWLPAGLAALLAAWVVIWLLRRRRASEDADGFLNEDRATNAEPRSVKPLVTQPAPSTESFDFSPIDWDGSAPAELQHSVAPITIEEADLSEEHESAVELADIMMSFGRIQGAAETLAEFIRNNPKQAVAPWLKLLEVYRTADMREDFEVITRQLNQTFNVKVVAWDDFDLARQTSESVEQMAHIVKALTSSWMTVDCQAYIQRLLRDNRDGARQGFPIAVIDDLLMLMAVLEDQLGPYTGAVDIPVAAVDAEPNAETPEVATSASDAPEANEAPIDFSTPLDTATAEPIFSLDDADITPSMTETTLPDLDFALESGDTPTLEDDETTVPEDEEKTKADIPPRPESDETPPPARPKGLDTDANADDGFTATELLGGFNRKRDD
ncbi:FimV/HubP-related protein [Denitromonas halophila]|uniref:FimV N-terminal domain-containing protein n=1 Tax=Denitromonas halophila TaxID=1629404 RepID=A0A557QX28_9RHOO|nr:hypothetical protein [Denitromonas halophila]TVO57461.1 hypothetical protein FHP91_07215 [Denitromonas halophila]